MKFGTLLIIAKMESPHSEEIRGILVKKKHRKALHIRFLLIVDSLGNNSSMQADFVLH